MMPVAKAQGAMGFDLLLCSGCCSSGAPASVGGMGNPRPMATEVLGLISTPGLSREALRNSRRLLKETLFKP